MFINRFIPRLAELNQTPHQEAASREKWGNTLAWLTGLLVLNNIVAITPGSQLLYQAFMVLAVAAMMPLMYRMTVSFEMIWLYIACIVSIVCNDIPRYYKIEYRLIFFIAVTLVASPAICSDALAIFRAKLFRILSAGCVVIVWLSAFRLQTGGGVQQGTSYYAGVTGHSMIMGPVSAIALLTLLFDILGTDSDKKENHFWKYVGILLSVYCLFRAASRTAVIAAFMATLFLMRPLVRNGRIFQNLLLVGICVLCTLPIWSRAWENVLKKNGGKTTLSLNSREGLWDSRIKEFKSSPMIGTGFATEGNIQNRFAFSHSGGSGQIEPGSSWLAILSMTGLLGGAAFFFLWINMRNRLKSLKDRKIGTYLFSLMIFVSLEMCAEGFIYSAGNFFCFYTWALVGASEAVFRNEQNLLKPPPLPEPAKK